MHGPDRVPAGTLLCPDGDLPPVVVPRRSAPRATRGPAVPGLTVAVASALTFGAAFTLGAAVVGGGAPSPRTPASVAATPGPGTAAR